MQMENWKKEFLTLHFTFCGEVSQIEKAYRLKYENLPKSIFKYMKFDENNYAMEHLKNNTVWLSNPSEFNDPFDSVLNIDFLAANHDAKMEKVFEIAEKVHKLPIEVIEEAKKSNNPEDYLTEYFLKTKGFPENRLKEFLKFHNDFQAMLAREARWNIVHDLRSKIRVGSFSEKFDQILMWTHYAENHKGFCVEYDLSSASEQDVKPLYPVNYNDDLINITEEYKLLEKPSELDYFWSIKAAIHKARDWAYESEWRLIIAAGNQKGLRKFFPIKAIYVGAKVDAKNREEILSTAKEKGIDVFRMYLSEDRFGLETEKIS